MLMRFLQDLVEEILSGRVQEDRPAGKQDPVSDNRDRVVVGLDLRAAPPRCDAGRVRGGGARDRWTMEEE